MQYRVTSPASVAVLGGIVGVCGPLLLSVDGQAAHVAHITLSSGWSWAALSYFAGMAEKRKRRSCVMGVVSLVCATLAYYVTKAVQGDFLKVDLGDHTGQTTYFAWGQFISFIALWCFTACLFGPILGLLGNLSRNGYKRHAFRAAVPLVVIAETSVRLSTEASLQQPVVGTTWCATRIAAMIILFAIAGYSIYEYWRTLSKRRIHSS
ncbi:DUF6518 family protein [Streptomyces sp. UH6]|uniref:DUF6518 family protein n=1 Tax=Streptomyces sp. UH6 TaxID=2748379 RepID=UPI0015D485EF|nr:DUF6518 family protein [Streptomyces sp. UH6]NYV72755.1 hypothetical protein [Streptomyces sp. UH6]